MNISDDTPQYIIADEGKIRQVLINLLGNAIKFTDEGIVILRTKRIMEGINNVNDIENGIIKIAVEVEDTGHGIKEDDRDRVFKSFEQVTGKKGRGSGTGLGLSISKKYARLLGGDISVTGDFGKGSIFTFVFTAEEGEASDIQLLAPTKRVVGIVDNNTINRVMVVDDQETNREILGKILSVVGFSVRDAKDGKESLSVFNSWKPQIVFMDILMPVMDGKEAIRKIRKLPGGNNVLIIVITASVLKDEDSEVMESGADTFIRKPFREYEIFDAIEKYTEIEFVLEKKDQEEDDKKQTKPLYLADKSISKLPEELVEEMVKALKLGKFDKLNELLPQVSEFDPELAEVLRDLVERLDYDNLITILNNKKK